MKYEVGDTVQYTASGVRDCLPPSGRVKGTVQEVESGEYGGYLVRWPMGLAWELPKHIRRVTASASKEASI